jgi:7-carboxy-7-deazaguanine synthase
MALRVLEMFDSLQGEGYWAGTPMTFVRLAGCNVVEQGLGCAHWCDTRGSWDRQEGEPLEIRDIILRVGLPRLCLTGGEPLLQLPEVARLAKEARALGMRVHVETNGTVEPPALSLAEPDDLLFDWVTVSPKPPRYDVAPGWAGQVDELKFVVDEYLTATTVERVVADFPEAVVSIQPVWGARAGAGRPGEVSLEPGGAATQRAVAMVMDHPEWRLSLQIQKLLGIR